MPPETRIDLENTRAQMRKGILEFCTLLVISQGKVYASDILGALKKADLIVVEGTLYPLLSRLRVSELVEYSWEESKGGPPRKYYTLTAKGRETLDQLALNWKALAESISTLTSKFK